MLRLILSVVLSLALLAPAAAQPEFRDYSEFQTRFGQLRVIELSDYEERVQFEGQVLGLPVQPRWTISGAWGLADGAYDWALVSWHHGGNSCGGGLYMLRVGGGPVAISPEMGACDGRIIDLRVTWDAMEIDMTDDDLAISHYTHRWDGVAYSRQPVSAETIPPAGAGADVTRWIGQHPYRPFEDRAEQMRFAGIMPPETVTELFDNIGPARPAVQRGDWVFGAGCRAHACNVSGGRWGMRISDGAVAAAIVEAGRAPRLFGPLARSPEFQAWLAEMPL